MCICLCGFWELGYPSEQVAWVMLRGSVVIRNPDSTKNKFDAKTGVPRPVECMGEHDAR
jgi:hypothetical protein